VLSHVLSQQQQQPPPLAVMAAASGDVDAVLQEALAAQEHEDEGDVAAAVECYARAASQLSYVLDLQVEKGSELGAMCQGMLRMYEQRMAVSVRCRAVCRPDDAAAAGQHCVSGCDQHAQQPPLPHRRC
jgi:hypothetical protein